AARAGLAVDVAVMIPAPLVHQDVPRAGVGGYHVARDGARVAERSSAVAFAVLLSKLKNARHLGRLNHLFRTSAERIPLQQQLVYAAAVHLAGGVERAQEVHAAAESLPVLLLQKKRHVAALPEVERQRRRRTLEEAFAKQGAVDRAGRKVHRYKWG